MELMYHLISYIYHMKNKVVYQCEQYLNIQFPVYLNHYNKMINNSHCDIMTFKSLLICLSYSRTINC